MTLRMPWAIDTPAENPVAAGRALSYAAAAGRDGVAAPRSLKVVPRAVPGQGVQLLDGAGFAIARSPGQDGEAYSIHNDAPLDVPMTATPTSGARSDLIVVRIEDPNPAGSTWPDPADPVRGPYLFPRVIEGVPAGTRRLQDVAGHASDTAVTLARIDRGAGIGTVNAGNIVDLRQLSNPRVLPARPMSVAAAGLELTAAGGARWPSYAPQVRVPEWATHLSVIAHLNSVELVRGAVAGILAVVFGPAGNTTWRSANMPYDEDWDGSSRRLSLTAGGAAPIPAALRGTLQDVSLEGRRDAAQNNGALRTSAGTQVVFDLLFTEQVE